MRSNTACVFYYHRENRYGINALLGALESDSYFDNLPVYLVPEEQELCPELAKICSAHKKVILGVSFCTSQLWETAALVKEIRVNLGNRVILIAGGPHPTGDPEGTLKLGFDIVVRGEGEKALIELLKCFDTRQDYEAVRGISFYRNGTCCTNRRDRPLELNLFPPFSLKYVKFGPLELTRGCLNTCSYCQTPRIFPAGIRHRSIETICTYIKQLLPYDYRDIRFITPDAFCYNAPGVREIPGKVSSLEKLLSSISMLLPGDGKMYIGSFPSEIRPEHISQEALELVRQYGANKSLVIGGQSGSDRVLEICRRNHRVSDIYRAVKLTEKMGFTPIVDFIFGLPFETEADREETARVMEELIQSGAKIHGHTFVPLPQTPFARAAERGNYQAMVKFINRLIHRGVIFGQWEKQALLAEKIYTYLDTRIL